MAGSSWGTSSHSFKSYGEHGATEFEAVNENVQCPPGVSGLHPHPQDCEKFLQCSNGQTFIQNCGPGTGFDSLRLVCDYKEKVQCGSGSVWAITTDVTTVQHGRELSEINYYFLFAFSLCFFIPLEMSLMLSIIRFCYYNYVCVCVCVCSKQSEEMPNLVLKMFANVAPEVESFSRENLL